MAGRAAFARLKYEAVRDCSVQQLQTVLSTFARLSFAVYHSCGTGRVGLAAPQYDQPQGEDFAANFFGGLFTTCGLSNFGPAGSDAYGSFGMHGRVNHLPAENISARTYWKNETCTFEITGTVNEAAMFGENLRLVRTLSVELGENRLSVHDVATNDGGRRFPHMLLYHCNMGFLLLDSDAQVTVSHDAMRARDEQAEQGLVDWNCGGEPDPTFSEQVFIHEPKACNDGFSCAIMVNRALEDGRGLALAIRYAPAQLPALFTWRMLGVKTYVMGIEPANCPTIEGRVEAGKRGTLPFLEPGESRSYDLEFEVLVGKGDMTVR
jgi:hypothetical protein